MRLSNIIDTVWRFLARLGLMRQSAAPISIETREPEAPAPRRRASPRRKSEGDNSEGDFIRRDWGSLRDLLETLGAYFKTMNSVRTRDPEGYALFTKAGGQIIHKSTLLTTTFPTAWKADPPSFGAVYLYDNKKAKEDLRENKEHFSPRMVYFIKIKSLLGGGSAKAVYRVCMYYENNINNTGAFLEYKVALYPDGRLVPLMEWRREMVPLKNSRKGKIPKMVCGLPSGLIEIFNDNKGNPKFEPKSPEEMAAGIMGIVAHAAAYSIDGFQVRVRRRDEVAAFNIPMVSTPVFFKDRDLTTNESGKRRRIFHIVRAHRREGANGEHFVKTHFRGERRFTWNGYSVTILMQGLHAPLMSDLTGEAIEVGPKAPDWGDYVDIKEAAGIIGDRMEH